MCVERLEWDNAGFVDALFMFGECDFNSLVSWSYFK